MVILMQSIMFHFPCLIEEVGVEINLISEVGAIIEYRDRFEFMQLSYCFLATLRRT